MWLVPPLRFPEFTREWKEEQLECIATFSKGVGISKEQLSETGEQCILYGELYTKYKSAIIKQVESKTLSDSSKLKRSKANDVIIPCSGETAVDIATARCVPFDNILLGGDLNIISLHKYDGAFMSYQLNGKRKYDIAKVAQGVSVVHLYGEHLKTIKTYNPTLPEQQKIAKLLSLLDERIATQNKIIERLQSLMSGIVEKTFVSTRYAPLQHYAPIITSGKDKDSGGNYPLYGSTGIIGSVSKPSYTKTAVLIARVGSIGNVQYVTIPCGISDNTLIIDAGENNRFIYYYLNDYNFSHITSGTTQPLITASSVKKIAVPIIEKQRKKKIIAMMNSIEHKLCNEKHIASLLFRQKDFLLSQMFI